MNAIIIIGIEEILSADISHDWRVTNVANLKEASQLRCETEEAIAILNMDAMQESDFTRIKQDDKITFIALSSHWNHLKTLSKDKVYARVLREGPWEEQLKDALENGLQMLKQKRMLRRLTRSLRMVTMESEIGKMHRGIALEFGSFIGDMHLKARKIGSLTTEPAVRETVDDLLSFIEHGRRLNKTRHHIDKASETPQICPLNKTLGKIAATLGDQTGKKVICNMLENEAYLGCEVADMNRLLLTIVSALQPYTIDIACRSIGIQENENMATIIVRAEANHKPIVEEDVSLSLRNVKNWVQARGGSIGTPTIEEGVIALEINLPKLWL